MGFELIISFVFGGATAWIALNEYLQKRLDIAIASYEAMYHRLESKIDHLDTRMDALEVLLAHGGLIERRGKTLENKESN